MDPHRLFQYSSLEAFDNLIYDGSMSVADLRKWGNFGLGCFNQLNGELIAFEGDFFHATADGQVRTAPEEALVSCVYMQHFSPRYHLVEQSIRYENLLDRVQRVHSHVGQPFFAIRLEGLFSVIRMRSVPSQTKPYPTIPEIIEKQALFEYCNTMATMVGFYFPSYVQGLTFPGLHLHFVTQDRQHGGHVLDFETVEADVDVDPIESYHLLLPDYARRAHAYAH
jgi:acetolactate decarboxylase